MRTIVVTVGLVALTFAAQSPLPRSFAPSYRTRLSIDFGTKEALKRLPQRPVECTRIGKHRHGPLPIAAQFVELPLYGGRHMLKTAQDTTCPVR